MNKAEAIHGLQKLSVSGSRRINGLYDVSRLRS